MPLMITITWAQRVLRLLPRPLLASLDAWSAGVARRRAQERRERTWRKTTALPPVVTGEPALPHPWRG